MKIKVFELDFDASNLHEVEFVKSVISGADLSSSIPCDTTAQLKVESPVEVKEIAAVPVTEKAPRKEKAGKASPAPVVEPAPEPVVEPAPAPEPVVEPAPEPVVEPAPETETSTDEQPTAKEMQDLVISLSKSGKLTRDEIMSIFHEFGGTSLMKIAPAKFALLKQRLITYKD